MRIIVFFDLPSVEKEEKREYLRFRKQLTLMGFIMLQESVYAKLALNSTIVTSVLKSLFKVKPNAGIVQVLCITEKQFEKMVYLIGEKRSSVVDSDERFIVI